MSNMSEISVAYDFRSDTMTTPLPEMIDSIKTASWGDSVYDEDAATAELEAKVARLTGKPAGLFCVSGTLSNQIGIRTNLHQPPHSVLCDYRAHVYSCEAGGLATLSQAMVTPVIPSNGVYITLEDIKKRAVLLDDVHLAPTRLISLENTLSGSIMPLEEVKRISEWAHDNHIRMHLDGARLWNAAAETNTNLADWCKYFDSVSLCLSKGLCAPIGSILVGEREFIYKAKWFRKQQGGGIRQAGWLATAAQIAIDKVWPTMPETHRRARKLAAELEKIGIPPALPVQTSFIIMDAEKAGLNLELFRDEAEQRGLKVWGVRIALHYWTSEKAIQLLVEALTSALERSKQGAQARNKPLNIAY